MKRTSMLSAAVLAIVLALAAGPGTGGAFAAAGTPSPAAAGPTTGAAPDPGAAEQEEERKRDRRGKRVRATLIEPAGDDDAEGETEGARGDGEPAGDADREAAPGAAGEAEPATGDAAETAAGDVEHDAEATDRENPAETSASSAATTTRSSAAEDAPASADRVGATPADLDRDQPPAFEERVEVIEVLLDVVVQDKQDNVVTGLGAEDFVVEEEGRPVEVTSATFYGAPEQLAASGEGDVARSDRYFILFFHDRARDAPWLRPLLLEAGQQARRWVEQDLLPNDQVAVVSYDVRLKVMTDFTRDREEIQEAISRAVASRKEPDRRQSRSREPVRSADSPSLLLNLPGGVDLRRETRVFEETLTLLGRAAEGIVGRKNLLLFSVGFGESDLGGMWVPDQRYYPDLEKSLNDGNVAVYGIDMVGSRRVGPPTGISSSLSSIADDTAGLYFPSFTSFVTPLRQAAEDSQGYYLISYRSEYPRGTSGYREVEVSTTDPKHDVRARRGYRYGQPEIAPGMPAPPPEDGAEPGGR